MIMMNNKSNRIFYIAFMCAVLILPFVSKAQDNGQADIKNVWGKWQVSLNFGTQMSGIKDEDFVAGNYAPLLNVSAGKWFSPALALQVGYKGWYFHQIIDDKKYNYGYYYGEAVLNVNSLFRNFDDSCIWSIYLHGGSGYFYNYTYERPNICADMGITNNIRLTKNFQANLDVSAIVGWDIYQGNEDVLPGISLGINYLF